MDTTARDRLTAAARRRLAAGESAAALNAETLASEAGIAWADAGYADLDALRCDLLQDLMDAAREESTRATEGMPAGLDRLRLALHCYLDASFKRPALREMTLLLQTHPQGRDISRRRVNGFSLLLRMELLSAGVVDASPIARLLTTMALETSLAEYEARRRLPEWREILDAYLNRLRAA